MPKKCVFSIRDDVCITGNVCCSAADVNAYAYGLYLSLGIFIPLIVTNCIIIGRAEAFLPKNEVLPAAQDGFWMEP
ncbi:hypothetical protein OK016_03430 [Vibrio chagasii]|nr:hypothetical protein [Vibrio chagasii]